MPSPEPGWERQISPTPPPTEYEICSRWLPEKGCLVSVSMLTFNHGKYLRKALDGVLNQKTDFCFEILVHDDASTDDSQAIIRDYATRYPNIVKPLYQTENQYSQGIYPSIHFNYPRATSDFVAICEGDDCWVDDSKLQSQINALAAHPEIDLSFHQAKSINLSSADAAFELVGNYSEQDGIVPFLEVLHRRNGFLPTSSCIIRQAAFRRFVDFLRGRNYLSVGDLYLQFFGALRGGAIYLAKPMSVYRINTEHSWSRGVSTDPVRKVRHEIAMIRSYCELDEITQHSFREEFQKLVVQRIFWLFGSALVSQEIIARLSLGELNNVYIKLLDVKADEDAHPPASADSRYVIYGAGSGCGLVMRSLKESDVVAIVDLYGGKVGQRMFNIPVISHEDIAKYRAHRLIVSTFAYDTTAFDHLVREHGFDHSQIVYFYRRMVAMIDIEQMLRVSSQILDHIPDPRLSNNARRQCVPPSPAAAHKMNKLAPQVSRVLTLEWNELPPASFSSGQERHAYAQVMPKATYSPWRNDHTFLQAFSSLQGLTLVDIYRCHELWSLLRQCTKHRGDIIEIGVWRGGTAALLGSCRDAFAPDRKLYLCDTFSGVVKSSAHDGHYRGGEHADTNAQLVRGSLKILGVADAEILEGIFPDATAHLIPHETRFCLAHIDVDTYDSAKGCFEYLWPKMTAGGAVVFDDYGFQVCSGVTTYCNEIATLPDGLFVHNINGHAIMIKVPSLP